MTIETAKYIGPLTRKLAPGFIGKYDTDSLRFMFPSAKWAETWEDHHGWISTTDVEIYDYFSDNIPKLSPPYKPEYFFIPEDRFEDFTKRIEKLSNKSMKLGGEAITIELLVEDIVEKVPQKENYVGLDEYWTFRVAKVHGSMPRVEGPWQFAARIEHTTAADGSTCNLLWGLNNAIALPHEYETKGKLCEHCGKKRERSNTYLVHNAETGEFKQIGRQCLQDFVGRKEITDLAKAFEVLYAAFEVDEDGEESFFSPGSRTPRQYKILDYLECVAQAVLIEGYVSKKVSEETLATPTSTGALEIFYGRTGEESSHFRTRVEVTPEAKELAEQAWEWNNKLEDTSDFNHKLLQFGRIGLMTDRHAGVIAYVVAGFQKDQMAEIEKQKAGVSSYVGEVGKRQTFTATFVGDLRVGEGYGGESLYLYRFVDESSNVMVWFTTGGIEANLKGTQVNFKATVKKHQLYRDVKQTELTRLVLM